MKRVGMRFIGRRAVGKYMAKRRHARNYLIVNALTKNFGSAGAQVLIAEIKKIDAQSSQVSWLNNVNVAAMLQEGDGDNGGMLFYLTTDSNWNDDYIISSNAIPGYGGKISMSAKRRIRENSAQPLNAFGMVYLWGEITDLTYTTDAKVRVVIDTWGKNLKVVELP